MESGLPVFEWFVVGPRAPEDRDAPDLLDKGGISAFRERGRERVTLAAVAGELYLDQAVRGERAVDFGERRIGDAGLADVHDGLEGVRARFEQGTLAGAQEDRHPPRIPWMV